MKIERTLNTLRLLFLIESKLFQAIKAHKSGKSKKAGAKKKSRASGYAINDDDDIEVVNSPEPAPG